MQKIIPAFLAGQASAGSTATMADSGVRLSTDGTRLYSYRMPIATRSKAGAIRMVRRETCPTKTTRRHWDACHALAGARVTAIVASL